MKCEHNSSTHGLLKQVKAMAQNNICILVAPGLLLNTLYKRHTVKLFLNTLYKGHTVELFLNTLYKGHTVKLFFNALYKGHMVEVFLNTM